MSWMWRHQTPGKIGAGSKLGDLPPGDRQVKSRDDFPNFPRFYVWKRSEKVGNSGRSCGSTIGP